MARQPRPGLLGHPWPHGTRARYVGAKCRCPACKGANRAYYHARQARFRAAKAEVKPNGPPVEGVVFCSGQPRRIKRCPGAGGRRCVGRGTWLRKGGVCAACVIRATVWNGLVPARRVRRHLARLSRAGVGYRQVADAAGVSATVMQAIMVGRQRRVRAALERAVLRVDEGAMADHALVDAAPTWRLIEQLLREGFSKRQLALRLGYATPQLQLRRGRIQASSALKVRRFYRLIMVG